MKTSIKNFFIPVFVIILTSANLSAQVNEENWVPVKFYDSKKIYINSTGLEKFTGDDLFVWVLQENDPPVEVDEVDGDVYKTKSYYLFNKTLRRYSILHILLYGNKDNVLKSYSYDRNATDESFKYNYPLFNDSDEELIFNKCLEISGSQNK